ADGQTIFPTGEIHTAGTLSDDRVSVRVPFGDRGSTFHSLTVFDGNDRTVRNFVTLTLATGSIGNRQLSRAGYPAHVAVVALNDFDVEQTDSTVLFDLDTVSQRGSARRSTDVERTHGELSTGFTDGLRSDNTDGLTHVDAVATGQIAAVTLGADAVANFTGNRRTHTDFVNTHAVYTLDPLLIDHGAGRYQNLVGARTHNVARNHS